MTTATLSTQAHTNASLPTWATGGDIQTVNVSGINLRYLKIGQGEPLVLVHTIRSQLEYFQKLIPTLAKHYRVYAIDLPAHGHSDITDQVHDKPMFINAVTGFIKALKLNDVTLMGESIGASISMGIAAEKNVKVKQVFALNPADYDNSNGLDRSSTLGKILFTGIRLPIVGFVISNAEKRDILQQVFEGGFNDNSQLPADFVTEMSEQGGRKGYPKAFRSIFLNWKSWVDGAKKYSRIDVPVTLIYSDDDWSLPAERVATQKQIRNSKLITVDNCGHFSALEKPAEILDIVLAKK
ncbi:MAG: alpha/beta hydrolase [Pseudomonadales bacterium]|nr:alpha/beta hydrolase [Pseudomonadales bacterium]